MDAKWGTTQSIVTNLTYNTDFAQVEDDEVQVNLTRCSFPRSGSSSSKARAHANRGAGGGSRDGLLGDAGFEDPHGHPESRELQAGIRMEMASSDQWAIEVGRNFERLVAPFTVVPGVVIPAGMYDFGPIRGIVTLGSQRPVSETVQLARGSFCGGSLSEVTWRGRAEFGAQFLVEPTISFNRFHTPWGDGDSNLVNSRFTYALSPRMFVSALVQYQSAADTVSTNARFRREYQPGSELFVVYSDERNTPAPGFPTLDNQSLVVKLTRLFRW